MLRTYFNLLQYNVDSIQNDNQDLRDLSLHNQEIWIVNVELDALEKVLNLLLGCLVTVQEIFRDVWQSHLSGDGDLPEVLQS
jgi:hypothetical protein